MKDIEKPKNFEGEIVPRSDNFPTGQTIMMFKTPQEYIDRMNTLYDEGVKEKKFPLQSGYLVGKIKEEYSLYLEDDHPDIENHNFIPDDIHEWIKDRIHQYLQFSRVSYLGIKTHTAWVNDYKAGEYNPNHIHNGSIGGYTNPLERKLHQEGLIGMMALKIPYWMGKEITNAGKPGYDRNGYTEFITGSNRALFTQPQITIRFNPGDFVVFPYDMWHCAYPHCNENETRRTFPTNIDVYMMGEVN